MNRDKVKKRDRGRDDAELAMCAGASYTRAADDCNSVVHGEEKYAMICERVVA